MQSRQPVDILLDYAQVWRSAEGLKPLRAESCHHWFCNKAEYADFLRTVPVYEKLLVDAGIQILKYYLDISKEEQSSRLAGRASDPLKQWKTSPIDAQAVDKWADYSEARDQMLAVTHTDYAPWIVVDADDKRSARLNIIRDLLWRVDFPDRDSHWQTPDPQVVRLYDKERPEALLHW